MSDLSFLDSRNLVGEFYATFEQNRGGDWAQDLAMFKNGSVRNSEDYGYLGSVGDFRRWDGERVAVALKDFKLTIPNADFEHSLDFDVNDMRADNVGQIQLKIMEQALAATRHSRILLRTLINSVTTGWDGVNFFASTHAESGTNQVNDVSATQIPGLNVATADAPTATEMATILTQAVAYMQTLQDDKGVPLNGEAKSFTFITNNAITAAAARHAVAASFLSGGADNPMNADRAEGISIRVINDSQITTTNTIDYLFVNAQLTQAPFIIQQATDQPEYEVLGEGTEYRVLKKKHLYAAKWRRGVGYGKWQLALRMTKS